MNINEIFSPSPNGRKYGKYSLKFELIEQYLKDNKNVNNFLDQLYQIVQLSYSNESKQLFALVSSYIKSDYCVDTMCDLHLK